jgi:hypothetical protein
VVMTSANSMVRKEGKKLSVLSFFDNINILLDTDHVNSRVISSPIKVRAQRW